MGGDHRGGATHRRHEVPREKGESFPKRPKAVLAANRFGSFGRGDTVLHGKFIVKSEQEERAWALHARADRRPSPRASRAADRYRAPSPAVTANADVSSGSKRGSASGSGSGSGSSAGLRASVSRAALPTPVRASGNNGYGADAARKSRFRAAARAVVAGFNGDANPSAREMNENERERERERRAGRDRARFGGSFAHDGDGTDRSAASGRSAGSQSRDW